MKKQVFSAKRIQKPFVIEYTEISPELAELTDAAGEFVYGDAHILCNMFQIGVLKKGAEGLPLPSCAQKGSVIDSAGNRIVPEVPNAYKFESFIFDAFAFYQEMGILRVERNHEFAPIKNQTGEDSPDTAQNLSSCWCRKTGATCCNERAEFYDIDGLPASPGELLTFLTRTKMENRSDVVDNVRYILKSSANNVKIMNSILRMTLS